MGFIQDNGTTFMSKYLTSLASLPGTVPSPLVQLGGIPYGQRAAPLAAIYDLGGASYVPGGSALRAPAPHDTTFTGPCHPDPEKVVSGSPLCHGVRLATLHPPFINGGHFGSLSSSSTPMVFIQDNGTAFMSKYLTYLVSLPGTAPSPLVRLGGILYGHRAAPLAAIYDLGGASYVPGGSALRAPAPHNTTFTGPCRPDPEKDISGSPLCHGVQLATLHPPFINGGHFGSPSSSSLGSSSVPLFWHPHGGSSFSSSPPPCHRGGLCTVVGPFPRAVGGILVRLHWLPRAWHLRARCFTLLCRRRITLFSSTPMGFIQDKGTAFMSQYLTYLVSLPGTAPSPLV
jgi:hypothetical protein